MQILACARSRCRASPRSHGALAVTENPKLELLTASGSSRSIRSWSSPVNPTLENLELAHLAGADGVRIADDPKLPADLVQRLDQLPPVPPPSHREDARASL